MKLLDTNDRRKGIGAAVCTLLLASQLAACGSSNSSSTPPPTGGTPPPPPPALVSLQLQGKVTDEPIANAEVTVTVGDETFTTTADTNGDYSVDIEIEAADADAFVVLSARGVGEQSFVEFTSLAGSFQSLADQAGDDETLSSDENFSTQITNVSTAEAVLLREANGGEPVTSNAALQSLASQINAQDVLDLATTIKLAVDNPEAYPLPEGQTSILELASNATSRQAFINEVYEQDTSAFAAMQAAIVQDSGLTRPIDIQGDYSFTTALLSTDDGFSFNYSGRVMHFDLLEDGTGGVSTDTHDVPMTWTTAGSTIQVTYNNPVETVSYDTENCMGDGGVRQVEAHYVTEGATLAFISARTVAITTTSDVTYADCASLAPREDVSTVARTVLSLDDFQFIDGEELRGETHTIYVYDSTQQAVVADIADLAVDGTGLTRLTNQSFTWSVDEETGKIVMVDFADGAHAEYLEMREIDEVSSDLFYEIRTAGDGPVYMGAGASVFADPEYDVDFTAADVPGRYYQFGVGEETYDDSRLLGFRLRFDTDFTGAQESDYINLDNEHVTVDETDFAYNAFRWTVEDQDVVVRRTWDNVAQLDNCLWGQANPDCRLYDERRIIPLAMDGMRVYWIEQRRSTNSPAGVTSSTPATHLVRFYDFEPLADAATGSAKSSIAWAGNKPHELLRGRIQR